MEVAVATGGDSDVRAQHDDEPAGVPAAEPTEPTESAQPTVPMTPRPVPGPPRAVPHPPPARPSPPTAPAPAAEATEVAGSASDATTPDELDAGPPVPDATESDATVPAGADEGPEPESFGRVAEDGTVFVRVDTDGEVERSVGSYPGATPDEALSYFARKYDALAAEVALLEQRIRNGLVPKEATPGIERLRVAVSTVNAVGDLPALDARLDVLTAIVAKRRAKADRERNAAREAARVTKEHIAEEAETLQSSTAWKVTGDRFRTLFDEWKAAPRLDKRVDDELWKRFSAARSAFDKTRRAHFAGLDAERAEASQAKERLVSEAEKLSGSTEWGATAAAYRDLMTRWKAAGRAGREEEETLWTRFRAAQDTFFDARTGALSERDDEQRANLTAKEALAVEAEALLPVTDLPSARAALRGIAERWEAIGHVPRGDKERIEGRLRAVEDAVRGREQDDWQRTNPEGRARAEAAVNQLRAAIDKLETQAAKAEAAGKPRELEQARSAIAARQEWLAEAQRALTEFSG